VVKTNQNENHAQQINSRNLKLPLRLISYVGKPFYLAALGLIFFVYITGYFFKTIGKNIFSYITSILLTLILALPKLLIQKHKTYVRSKTLPRETGLLKKIKKTKLLLLRSFYNLTIFFVSITFKLILVLVNKSKKKITSWKVQSLEILSASNKYILTKIISNKAKYTTYLPHLKSQLLIPIKKIAGKVRAIKPSEFLVSKRKKLSIQINFYVLFLRKLYQKTHRFSKEKVTIKHIIKPKSSCLRLKIIGLVIVLMFTLSLSVSFAFWKYVLKDLPSVSDLATRSQPVSTKIYDRNGILLYTIYKDYNRTPIPLSEIPVQVRLSTLAIEDAEFYSHPGFSLRGIARALYKNWKKGQITGGSTITQQLVKNTLLTPEKTLTRKLKEIILAIKVEKTFTKDQIFQMYLNEVGYGSTAYGIQEGARLYFGKNVENLTLGEAALLAGIPKSPTQYSPFGAYPENAKIRQKEVLHLMEVNKYITQEQKIEAEKEDLAYAENKTDIKAPHFVMHVRDLLEKKYGAEVVAQGGLEVRTTLDYNIQRLAENAVSTEVEKLTKLNVTNGAAVVLNPQSGEIIAMVGSRNYFDQAKDGNVNVTTSLRQPGSSIKIINYAYALSNGYTPASILDDSPVTFVIPNQEPYTPKNYEGGYRGKLTLRSAFAESRNIPAVKVLNSYGVKNMIELGQKMGITTWNNPQNYGLSLTLGGGDVKLLDLAYVYATVANYGNFPEPVSILKITANGELLEEAGCSEKNIPFTDIANATGSALAINVNDNCKTREVLKPEVAYLITDILRDNPARAPSFGTNSQLVIPKHPEVAVKTGTSNNLRDNLTIGYTQKYVVAVWVGNNDNSPMSRIASGVTGASTIFNNIMSGLLANEESLAWNVPAGLVQLPICQYTGSLACQGCPVKMEWFLESNKPAYACNSEQIQKILTENKKPQILDHAWRSDE